MAGRIPSTFIDSLMARVDIVDVIDRRVPLTRKGREYQARCPFHEEKTPSFTVSPSKQFYHCFGCGAHGTAIGFLMDYANLSFVEAVEELADDLGMEVPREGGGSEPPPPPGESPGQLLGIVEEASGWFQLQLRQHPDAGPAARYLESRGLDERTRTAFGIGFAPDGWDGLVTALGTDDTRRVQLLKTGLVSQSQKDGESGRGRIFDRFRGRIIFPIEDHRGRVVAFGGRALGDGEPKYLNSPETSLFHKGAELYGLHRARRAIGQAGRSLVVEGYMDVVSLVQFGVDNAVATLGTATTRTHLQRLFRLAPEIVFCFDGDRAGRDAAWKALQVAMPEMQDGRQLGFLFLPEGEDPDTVVRGEGAEAFGRRVEGALPLDRFVFDTLTAQVDMERMDGKARLVSLARPLIGSMPESALRQMMLDRLSSLTGLRGDQVAGPAAGSGPGRPARRRGPAAGQLSPMATAISLLLQYPGSASGIDRPEIAEGLRQQGADHLRRILGSIRADHGITTARLVEEFRDSGVYEYIAQLVSHDHQVPDKTVPRLLNDTLERLQDIQEKERRDELLEKSREPGGLDPDEMRELRRLLALLAEKKARPEAD